MAQIEIFFAQEIRPVPNASSQFMSQGGRNKAKSPGEFSRQGF
jgi:hypothetical protein